MQPGTEYAREPTLDVARGIAILFVLVFHLQIPTGIAAIDVALRPLAIMGWAGVDVFFVLSGFLVGRMILVDATRPGGLGLRRFFVRRALRLWPVLLLYLATLLAVGGAGAWDMVWPVLLHVQNYSRDVPSHLWSLAVEEHFYLVAAFALPLALRHGGARGLAIGLGVLIVGCTALRTGALLAGESLRAAQWQTQYRIDALAAGVLLAVGAVHRPALLARAGRRRGLWLAIAVAGFAMLTGTVEDAWRYSLGLTIAWLASAALLLALQGASIPAILRWPARGLAALGTIAYSLYIWHASVAQAAAAIAPALGIDAPIAVLAFKFVSAVNVAIVVHCIVERPMMRLRDFPAIDIAKRLQLKAKAVARPAPTA